MKSVRVSASQIQLASLCWRKWAFAYIEGKREPETRQLALGTRVHFILEAYLKYGKVPDPYETWSFREHLLTQMGCGNARERGDARRAWDAGGEDDDTTFYPGKIAMNMMPPGVFPAPGEGYVEHEFAWHDRGIVWNGLLDWHDFDPDAEPEEFDNIPGHEKRGRITIVDHKTSSDPAKWGKLGDDFFTHIGVEYAPEEEARRLHFDAQAIIYARAMLAKYGPANVIAHWNYGSTRGVASKSRVATTRYAPGTVYALFENKVRPVGEQIRKLRVMKADPLSLPPNPDACHAYHKECPHASTCNLSTAERIGNIVMGNALVDSLLQQASAPAETKTTTPEMPPVEPGGVNPPEASAPPQIPVEAAPVPLPSETAPKTPKTRKPRASKKTEDAPNGLATVLAQLKQLKDIDEDMSEIVAAKLADKIADKLLEQL